jgi:phosphotransferase system HPr (HPr) family protein
MKTIRVSVPWAEGLHIRPAARVVAAARGFKSVVSVRLGAHVAEASSILALVMLCATLNTVVDIEAHGDDEQDALKAVAACFDTHATDSRG